jgi:ABC-type transport system involved in cytochrome c biogenesis permease subunit
MTAPLLLPLAIGTYGLALLMMLTPLGMKGNLVRWIISVGLLLHVGWLCWRGLAIGFMPLTNKAESFSAAAFALALVVALGFLPSRAFVVPQLVLAVAAGVAAALFPQDLVEPGPMLRTWWYPAHVPLSFLGLATWSASASAGLAWMLGGERTWLKRVDQYALQGLLLWSLAMIFGGVWGVVAWGAYFMWDPKVVWSTILWIHYASFIHVRLTPSLGTRLWVRPALAWLGIVWILVAYVGTSFFFGKSVHAF